MIIDIVHFLVTISYKNDDELLMSRATVLIDDERLKYLIVLLDLTQRKITENIASLLKTS